MIADNQTTKVYFSEWLKNEKAFRPVYDFIYSEFEKLGIKSEVLTNTNDVWARDYMPIQVSENRFIEFRYDPDYLQGTGKESRELKTYPDIVCEKHNIKTIKSGIILDGGNVVKSNNCVILTNKIFEENKYNYSKTEIIKALEELFETDKIVIIPWFNDDKKDFCGHSDGMVRFIDDQTVLVNHIYRAERTLLDQLKKAGLNCEYLEYRVKKDYINNWAYINFLQTSDVILLPKLEVDEDEQALKQILEYYPEYASANRIIQIPFMKPLVEEGGALNCISWSIKA